MSTPDLIAEGKNHRITLERGAAGRGDLLLAVVWRREDLTSAEGAEAAVQLSESLMAALQRPGVGALILDLSEAPPVVGPRTLEVIGNLIQRAVNLAKGVHVVSGANATQRLQLERLVREHGAAGAVVASLAAARALLARS